MSLKAQLEALKGERVKLLAQHKEVRAAADETDEGLTDENVATLTAVKDRIGEIDEELTALAEKEAEQIKLLAELDDIEETPPQRPNQPQARGVHVQSVVTPQKAFMLPPTIRRIEPTNFSGEMDGRQPQERAYRFGQWALARAAQCMPSQFNFPRAVEFAQTNGMMQPQMAHQEGGNDTSGAHIFVPEEFTYDIIKLIDEYGAARRLLNVESMASDTKVKPKRVSGLTAYAVGESAAGTESDAAWTDVRLTARKWMVLTRMSSELNEDSVISIGNELVGEVAYAYAVKEDDTVLNGDGTSSYHGIEGIVTQLQTLTAGTAPGLIAGAGNSWSELTLANFHSVCAALPQYARRNARWICSSTFFYAVMQPLALAAGGTLPGDIANGVAPRFLGYPVEFTETMPGAEATGTLQLEVIFGDINLGCLFGDRRMLQVDFSTEASVGGQSLWERDQIGIRATERFDFNCFAFGSNTAAGPICGLESLDS